jgi:hypothetical protein
MEKYMKTHTTNRQGKSPLISKMLSQNRRHGKASFQFKDNRLETVAQKKRQEIADNYSIKQPHLIQKKENHTGLPDNLKSSIENLSGHSMNDVKVHYNSPKPAQLQAHAYAQGTDIHLASGQEKHLPHEVWHVVQQKQGRVKSTLQMKNNININDDTGLEKEADVMGDRISGKTANIHIQSQTHNHTNKPLAIQRKFNDSFETSFTPSQSANDTAETVMQVQKPSNNPSKPVIQRFTKKREPRSGSQIKLSTQIRSKSWKLELINNNGKGDSISQIMFLFDGKSSRLSIDSMKGKGGGAGTILMKNIPWAVQTIVQNNLKMTKAGKGLGIHSGFANIIAYQMSVKNYATTLGLRAHSNWTKHWFKADQAVSEKFKRTKLSTILENSEVNEPILDESKYSGGYNFTKFPNLWADTQVLLESGMVKIDAGHLKLSDVNATLDLLEKTRFKTLKTNFSAYIDILDLSETKKASEMVDRLRREAEALM